MSSASAGVRLVLVARGALNHLPGTAGQKLERPEAGTPGGGVRGGEAGGWRQEEEEEEKEEARKKKQNLHTG